MSTRWFGPGPTFAVTMTRELGWAEFQMHLEGGYRDAWRANLIACVEGVKRRTTEMRRRDSDGVSTDSSRDWRVIVNRVSSRGPGGGQEIHPCIIVFLA